MGPGKAPDVCENVKMLSTVHITAEKEAYPRNRPTCKRSNFVFTCVCTHIKHTYTKEGEK